MNDRLTHVKGMIKKIEALSKELYVEFDEPINAPFSFGVEMRSRFDNLPRSLKARDVWEKKHKRLKRLIKELYKKHGEYFIKEQQLPHPSFEGRMTVMK